MENLNEKEKLDYIYKTLKKQENRRKRSIIIKIIIYSFLALFSTYMYFFWINLIISWIKKSMQDSLNTKTEKTINFLKKWVENLKNKY